MQQNFVAYGQNSENHVTYTDHTPSKVLSLFVFHSRSWRFPLTSWNPVEASQSTAVCNVKHKRSSNTSLEGQVFPVVNQWIKNPSLPKLINIIYEKICFFFLELLKIWNIVFRELVNMQEVYSRYAIKTGFIFWFYLYCNSISSSVVTLFNIFSSYVTKL